MEEELEKTKDIVSFLSSKESSKELSEEDKDDIKTMLHQDLLALKEMKEKGMDADESFRLVRLGDKKDHPHYHVFSTEGREEKVEEELRVMRRRSFFVDNESAPSYRKKRIEKKRWEHVIEPSVSR